ncbi:MAG: SpoIIE family protein phosphatase [Blastocatellia bacterium]|nr:SpoIIE family protein phosphatase [Blastocatellia bacterium]
MTNRLRLLLGGAFLALMLFNVVGNVYAWFLPFPGSADDWGGGTDGVGRVMITRVKPAGAAAELRVGDEVLAVNGVNYRDDPQVLNYSDTVPPGTRYRITVRRDGQVREAFVTTVPHRERRRLAPETAPFILFLLTGLAVFLLRPADKQAWLLMLMFGAMTGLGSEAAGLPAWWGALSRMAKGAGLFFIPLFAHFFLIFPERSPLLVRWPRLERYLHLPYLLVVAPLFLPSKLLGMGMVRFTHLWIFRQQWLWQAAQAIVVGYLVVGLLSIIVNYRAASSEAREKLRVVLAGSIAGFLNLLLLVAGEMTRWDQRFPRLWAWFGTSIYFTLSLVPIGFVYAIVRHKVIPVRLIIRRGVRYLLVSRGAVLLEALAVTLVVTVLLTVVFSRLRPSGFVIGIVSAMAGIGAWRVSKRLHEKYLAPLIDRRFFRQSYDSQQILADLAESMRTTTDLATLMERVAMKVQSALQTERVTVLLWDEASGDYLGGASCEYRAEEGRAVVRERAFRLPHFAESIAALRESGHPLDIEDAARDRQGPHPIEAAVLAEMNAVLLLPLMGKEGMPGILALGPRLGDVSYSGEDKRLLMSVAGPTTLAIENARLVARMIEEARRREEIEAENEARARELEEARQLQLSMLPRKLPQLPTLQVAAYMKTATEVGGDYYDFHISADGALTIAIGDATGHGLKAGTVVTAMKSLFRTHAEEDELARVLSRSSRVLKEMNLRSLFMALTLVKIRGDRMEIAAAGMPAALIYRAADRSVHEVAIKSLPLGSLSNYIYHPQTFSLAPGDVVVLLSDGFPERFNEANEILGFSRAGEMLPDLAPLSPQQIIDRFVDAGDQWAQGRPQDDDVTFVVLKMNN